MHKEMNAETFIKWANKHFDNNLDFTLHLLNYVKPNNPELFESVMVYLDNNDNTLKFIKHVATS